MNYFMLYGRTFRSYSNASTDLRHMWCWISESIEIFNRQHEVLMRFTLVNTWADIHCLDN